MHLQQSGGFTRWRCRSVCSFVRLFVRLLLTCIDSDWRGLIGSAIRAAMTCILMMMMMMMMMIITIVVVVTVCHCRFDTRPVKPPLQQSQKVFRIDWQRHAYRFLAKSNHYQINGTNNVTKTYINASTLFARRLYRAMRSDVNIANVDLGFLSYVLAVLIVSTYTTKTQIGWGYSHLTAVRFL